MKGVIPFLLFTFFLLSSISDAQENVTEEFQNLEISVLTCGSGDQLYALFGHTALLLTDESRNLELVYNWGTFDFNAPNFGIKFLRGKLPYALSVARKQNFINEYQIDKRWISQQVLALSPSAKVALIKALNINLEEENRFYKYDFYYDNCTTRIRDLIENVTTGLQYPDLRYEPKTFRDLLHENLTDFPWTKFGMDIILGTQSDQLAGQREQMFLPFYFMEYLDGATSDSGPIVAERTPILEFLPQAANPFWLTPLRLFIILLVIELIGLFLFYISGDKGFLKYYDILWWTALMVASFTFSFMWWATDHTVCANNWNLIWAPPWLLLLPLRNTLLRKICFSLTLGAAVILIIGWTFIPQEIPIAIIPIALISVIKCLRSLGIKSRIDQYKNAKLTVLFLIMTCSSLSSQGKIDGITMVAPPQPFQEDPMAEVLAVNANWIAFVPFAYSRSGEPEVRWGSNRQWWGERIEGIKRSIELAQKSGLKIMIKPQVFIPNGWVGEMEFDDDDDWKKWESSYRAYLITFARIAAEYNIELLCIGTEYRIAVNKREAFWRQLIKEIRQFYKGLLTYSSNWDSYEKVPFWDALDYVGISAYFPLSDMDTPPTLLLSYRWNKYVRKLRNISKKYRKQILFTEFGYLSVDGAAGKTWELEKKINVLDINEQAQANGYQALLASFWKQDFWAGGFLWKWFPEGQGHEGYPERDYTPQNKKASKVVSEWYAKQ